MREGLLVKICIGLEINGYTHGWISGRTGACGQWLTGQTHDRFGFGIDGFVRSSQRTRCQDGTHCHNERATTKRTPMTIRVAAIEVSHWHALNDAAYLRHLVA